jgi:hypothetical protein
MNNNSSNMNNKINIDIVINDIMCERAPYLMDKRKWKQIK